MTNPGYFSAISFSSSFSLSFRKIVFPWIFHISFLPEWFLPDLTLAAFLDL